MVDLGAQWVHGDQGNDAYDLAAPLNLTDHSDPYAFKLCASNGAKIDPILTKNITDLFLYYLDEMNNTALEDCSGSLSACLAPKYILIGFNTRTIRRIVRYTFNPHLTD